MSPRRAVDRAILGRVASWDLEGRPGLQVRRMGAAAVGRPEERPALPVCQAVTEGAAERGAAERGAAERGAAERGAVEREAAEREAAEREAAEREAAEREAAEWGAVLGRLAAAASEARPVAGVSARVGKREGQVRPASAGWAARIK